MVEVTFSESVGGALKAARGYCEELSKSDIVCLWVMADIGDITEPMFGEYRYKLLCKMVYQEQWGSDEEDKEELKRLGKHYAREYQRLKTALKEGEPVRLWVSELPYMKCGMLWLSGLLSRYNAEVCTVELRQYDRQNAARAEKSFVIHSGWGECEPQDFANALPLSRRLTPLELRANAMRWDTLVRENTPLRTVISGNVVSVPVNFYDFLIWRYLKDKPIKEALLLGKILGENRIGLSDWWAAYRIEHFIRRKSIIVIEDNERRYARILKRAKRR